MIGTAIALKLLFGLPLMLGVLVTVFDVLLVLWLQQRGFRQLEALVIGLTAVVVVCIGITVAMAQPHWHEVMAGFVPNTRTFIDPDMLYIAIGIIGATVMPHNLYLHSSIVKARRTDPAGRRWVRNYTTIDIIGALVLAFVINASILVMAGAAFHAKGLHDMADLQDAHRLLVVDDRRHRWHRLCSGAARVGPEFRGDRDADRPDRHGRLPALDDCALAASPADARSRGGTGVLCHEQDIG